MYHMAQDLFAEVLFKKRRCSGLRRGLLNRAITGIKTTHPSRFYAYLLFTSHLFFLLL